MSQYNKTWLVMALRETREIVRLDHPGRAVVTVGMIIFPAILVYVATSGRSTTLLSMLYALATLTVIGIGIFSWKVFSIPGRLDRELRKILTEETRRADVANAGPHPHDVELARKFSTHFSTNDREFLRKHDLGGTFPSARLNSLYKLSEEWVGPQHEFQDEELNNELTLFKVNIRQFLSAIAQHANPTGANSEWISLVPHRDRQTDFWTKQTMEMMKQFNDSATALIDQIDKLEKLAISKLRVSL